jgi:hypothetical protein
MVQNEELKAHMVKALTLAQECLSAAGLGAHRAMPGDPVPEVTAISILAVELFKHLDS